MRRDLYRRFALYIYSIFGKVEPASRIIVWTFGMILAVITVVTVLSLLGPIARPVVLFLLILFLVAGLIVFVRDIPRIAFQWSPSDSDKITVADSIESHDVAQESQKAGETIWPAVHYAYDFIMPKYEMTERRYVAAEHRIEQLLAISVAIMLASVAILQAAKVNLELTTTFVVAVSALSLQVVVGLITTASGHIRTLGLRSILTNALHYQEWEFKKNVLYWATEDIEANQQLVNRKGLVCWLMTLLFVVEAASLTWWIFALMK